MSKGPEGGCPEPIYPRELRSGKARFEGIVDMGPEGEGVIIFESTTSQQLIDGLRWLSAPNRRVWIDDRIREAFERRSIVEE